MSGLLLNRVYIHKKQRYYVFDKKLSGRKFLYSMSKVLTSGAISSKVIQKSYTKGAFKIQADKVEVRVTKSKIKRNPFANDKKAFDELVTRALILTDDFVSHSNNKELKIKIAKLVYASIYFKKQVKTTKGVFVRNYNLRDFSKAMGHTRHEYFYRWVGNLLKSYFTPEKFNVAIPDMADSTLVSSLENFKLYRASLKGFNKSLDLMLKKNLQAYTKEFKARGLSL